MEPLYQSVARLLRPQELLKLAAEVHTPTTPSAAAAEPHTPQRREKRIVCVVANVDRGVEEACVFVLRRRTPTHLAVLAVLPIYKDFRITMTQAQAVPMGAGETVGAAASPADPTGGVEFRKTGFAVHLRTAGMAAELFTDDAETVQDLLIEVRRLVSVAEENNFHEHGRSHAWCGYYTPSLPSGSTTSTPLHSPTSLHRLPQTLPSNISAPASASSAAPAGMGATSPFDVASIREDWLRRTLESREAEFTSKSSISVRAGTFNVNGRLPTEDLTPWVRGSADERAAGGGWDPPDLLVLGFQELDLSTEALLVANTLREDAWCTAVLEALGEEGGEGGKGEEGYVKVASRQLVGILIVVFAKRGAARHISEVTTSSVGTGVLGMMGNKGATAVRLRFRDSYLCFINSHLAAFTNQTARRNQDFHDISRRLAFVPPPSTTTAASSSTSSSSSTFSVSSYGEDSPPADLFQKPLSTATVNDAHHVIWLGDLNYRIELPSADVKAYVDKRDWAFLIASEQLTAQRRNKAAFAGFEEGAITFPPTYKYDVGTSTFDTSEKQRCPAYCDRILYRSKDPLSQHTYSSYPSLTLSDHKPVASTLSLTVRTVDAARAARVHTQLLKELDNYENEARPQVEVSEHVVELGEVGYLSPRTREVSIRNTGQVVVTFRFIPKAGDTAVCRPWLWAVPQSGLIIPGESETIKLTALVDNSTAPALNAAEDKLEDILVLNVQNGLDAFITVQGTWLPTCFANPLTRLVRLPRPIRTIPLDTANDLLVPTANAVSVPRELFRMMDWLSDYVGTEGLFLSPGSPELVQHIRECLDAGEDFGLHPPKPSSSPSPPPPDETPDPDDVGESADARKADDDVTVHSMAETVIRFLESLPDPIVPYPLQRRCEQAVTKEDAFQSLDALPSAHVNTLIYLTSFLRLVVEEGRRPNDKTVLDKLAAAFAPIILRPDPSIPADRAVASSSAADRKRFVLHFLS